MDFPGNDLLDPSGSDESFIDHEGCNASARRALLHRNNDVSRSSPILWNDSQDPCLDAGGGRVYEGMAPPASPSEGGLPSTQPNWGTQSVGSDAGRASSSSATAADTAAAALTAVTQDGSSITLMQQMREQLRRSHQSSAEEGSVEGRGERVGGNAPPHAQSSALLPQQVIDRALEGPNDLNAAHAEEKGELPAVLAGSLESEPIAEQDDDHYEASDAHETLQQSSNSASELATAPAHPPPQALPSPLRLQAPRLPQELPSPQQPQPLPQQHQHRPRSPHALPAPRPAVRNSSPGQAVAVSTHKKPAAKGSKTRKPSPGRLAQNLALFGQAPRPPSTHTPPPTLQQAAQEQQYIEEAADEPQPTEELGGWRNGGCLDPAAVPAPATSQRPDPQQQHLYSEEAALEAARHSRASSAGESARLSDASTASNSVDNSRTVANAHQLEGMRVHEGPAALLTSLAAAAAPAPLMAPTALTATQPKPAPDVRTLSPTRRPLSSSSAHASGASRPIVQSPGLPMAVKQQSSGGRTSARSPGSVAASGVARPRSATSDAAAAAAANREGPQLYTAPRSGSPGAMPSALNARNRARKAPRPRDWDKSVLVQPLPMTKARFVYELQMAEMASQKEQDQAAGDLNKAPSQPKSLKEPPDDREGRLQLMYYREVAARKMQERRMEQARQEHEQAQLQDCTFVPSITKMSAWITRHNSPAGRACLSQGRSLGSPGRGFTSPRPAAGSPGKSHRSSSAGGGGSSTRTTPPRGHHHPSSNQVMDHEQSSETGQSAVSLTSTERQERQAVFDRLYRQAAALEQRRQQRLEEEREEQQRHMFRARSPGTERIASNHYMLPKSGPRPNLLPTGMDQCTFRPRTNFARHVHANPRPDPEAEQLRAFDDDDFYSAAMGISVPPSPARLAGFHSPGHPGGGGAVLAQRRQAASMRALGSPVSKKLADPSIRGSSETEQRGISDGIMSNAPNALHSISDKLDWDEFLSRQYAFLSQQILRNLEESGAPASPPKPILSSGSAKIMQRKEMEGEHYIPPYQRPLSPGRSDLSANTRSTAGKAASSFSQASLARDRIMGSHKVLGEEPSHKPLLTAMAARLPSRTAAELMEGGRELREAKLAELRRQLDEQEKAATPFKPTNFSKKDRYPEVMPRLSRQNPGQHLVTYAQKKLALEERRMQVQAEREAAEMAECTFHPRTNPLPAYLWKAHQWDVEQLAGPDIDLQLDQGESEPWEGLEDAGSFWPAEAGLTDMHDAAAGGCWPGDEYGDPGTSWVREEDGASGHFKPMGHTGNNGSSIASSMSSIQMSKPAYDQPGRTYPHLVHRQLQQQQQQHNSRSSSRSGFSRTVGLYGSHAPDTWYPGAADPQQQQQAHRGSQLGHLGRAYLPLPEEYASDEDAGGMGCGSVDVFGHQQRQRQQRPSLQDLPELLEVGEQQPHRRVPETEQRAANLPLLDGFEIQDPVGAMPSPAPPQPGAHFNRLDSTSAGPMLRKHAAHPETVAPSLLVPPSDVASEQPQAALQQQQQQDGSLQATQALLQDSLLPGGGGAPHRQQQQQQQHRHRDSISLSLPPQDSWGAAAWGHAPSDAEHHADAPSGLPPGGVQVVLGGSSAQHQGPAPMPTSDLDVYKQQLAQMQAQLMGT